MDILLQSCVQNGNNNLNASDTTQTLGIIEGHWFLQPLDKKVALALANTKGMISINFLDSVYCNVEIKGFAGNLTLSRKYKIDSTKLIFEDPTVNKKIEFNTSYVNSVDSTFFILNSQSIKLFKVYPYDQRTVDLLNSENTLQRNEFLYPTLTVKERIGLHFEDVNGRLQEVDSAKTTNVDLYKLF